MLKFGLTDNVIKKINDVFVRYPNISQVVLYGSRAKGNYKKGSDIDLVLKGTDLNLTCLNKISLDLDDLLLPYTFDLSNYDQIDNQDLLNHIDRIGILFYARK